MRKHRKSAISAGGQASEVLKSLNVKIFDDEICTNAYSTAYDSQAEFCAGHLSGGRDACQGDSGMLF